MKRIIISDIKRGILLKYYWFVIIFITSIILTVLFCNESQNILKANDNNTISFLDCLIHQFRGMEEYKKNSNKAFDVSDSYLIWNFIIAVMVASYPSKDIEGIGKNILILSKSRVKYWISKVIWMSISVVLSYAAIIVGALSGIVLSNLILGNKMIFSFDVNTTLFYRSFNIEYNDDMKLVLLIQVVILPIISWITIFLLQMLIQYVFNPVIGYIYVICVLVLSAYYMKFYWIGNNLMLYRNKVINPSGINVYISICFEIGMIAFFFVGGVIIFRRKEIM